MPGKRVRMLFIGNSFTTKNDLPTLLSGSFFVVKLLPKVEVRAFEHGSNIFPLTLAAGVDAEKVVESLRHSHVFLYPDEGTNRIFRLTVNTTILRQSNGAIFEAFEASLGAS